jgi:anti-sigma factor RsiW
MADIFALRPSEHDRVQQLLPWYVNGTLSVDEIEQVDAHLAACDECRSELAIERKLARDVATLPLDVDSGWKAMTRRLADERRGGGARSPIALLRRRVPLGWAAGASLAASVAAVVAVIGLQVDRSPEQTYRALGTPDAAAGGQAVVLFKPDTTEQQMRVILSANDARLVDGPTAAGAYVLRIERGSTEDAIRALRQSSQVVLAEPIASDGGR